MTHNMEKLFFAPGSNYVAPIFEVVRLEERSFVLTDSDNDFVGGNPEDFTENENDW